jgi:hypothetical protein
MEFPNPAFSTDAFLKTKKEAKEFDYEAHQLTEPDYESLIAYRFQEDGNIYIG